MAKKYDEESFGPAETYFLDNEEMTMQERKEKKDNVKASEGLIKIGCNRILEKVKNIRQKFSTALVNETRSENERIVLEHFNLLLVYV